MVKLVTGHWVTQALFVAAKLGIADLLAIGPRTPADLAEAAGANGQTLYRLLRALASEGVFAEDGEGRFGLTPLAECLRTDVPGSVRSWVLVMGEAVGYLPCADLLHSVKTGETAFLRTFGVPFFDYLGQHAGVGRLFDESMTSFSVPEVDALVKGYDFSGIGTLVDVAGGYGTLLAAVLKANPGMKGVLADVPAVIAGSRDNFAAAGLSDRCSVEPIDFFESVPAGGDAYLMKHIIHDWDDARAITILKNCRKAMGNRGKLLLAETVMRPGNDPEFAKWLDICMLIYPGGCERTESEYRDLLEASGFRLTRIVPTTSPLSVVEAAPV